jgi:hypothetical protein
LLPLELIIDDVSHLFMQKQVLLLIEGALLLV